MSDGSLAALMVLGPFVLFAIIMFWYQFHPVKAEDAGKEHIKQANVEEIINNEENAFTAKLTEDYLTLENYVGQENKVDYLLGHIKEAKKCGKPLPHIVLWGSGGLGKSTLVKAIANDMGGRFIEIVPANLRSIKDLFGIFFMKTCDNCGMRNPFSANKCFNVGCKGNIAVYYEPYLKILENDIIFLEECHGLKPDIEEAMYSLMQDGYVMLRYNGVDQRVTFPKITIAGATTKLGDLSKPFRDRFKIEIQLEPYTKKEIFDILTMFCEKKGIDADSKSIEIVTNIAHGVPRIAKKYIEDAKTRSKNGSIGEEEINEVLKLLKIDEYGLNELHRKILSYIHIRGQAGQTAIASSVGLNMNIYREVYEPSLMYSNLIWQGSRGRVLTDKAKKLYFNGCNCKYCEE